ncbi:phenylalanine--tRNA ligase subunit beta [Mobilitalea sibirica]|uniref:Phenylalanine--tRNA ligase beta subunit n=1 Tax=Mobilitalea sibirica TaxID=1462919 RepID=A0A8J7KWA7_9FIRM|nr:phenylalanine--tRNA ligase subunit beta [Mobilitalea sibirica]MBH1940182.1 phenylalanine--tRNA ligase subunit beta [Mobilitalea sibirica]
MLISMNWISEFTDLSGVDIKELINQFTLSTAEVEDIYEMGKNIKDVVVGKLVEINDHPNSKKLHLVKVDIGSEVVECVCGAPNVFVGAVVPFAKLGGQVGELVIKEVQIAGATSRGMCCSEKELGISDNHEGLMILDDIYPLGTDIKEFMQLEDTVFEVDNKSLTNRPDLWGHYGIAREIATLTKRPLKPLELMDTDIYRELAPIDLKVENTDKIYRYSCITIDNITKKKSPINMRIRLTYCGMRPINLLADLTNYLMMEMGQPMHAFDNGKVSKIRVKTMPEQTNFLTLDGVERKIDTDTLMICDEKEPVAIAGIMGGELSEITDNTDSVLLESANFDAVSVRKSATRLGMRTDASARYEKTIDPELTVPAIKRFLKLLAEIDPGVKVTSALTDCYVKHYETITIQFDKAYVDKYTGIDISSNFIEETLTALGFGLNRKGDEFEVVVPSWRATKDVTMKADMIEEITRIYGYDNFEIKSTKSLLTPIRHSEDRDNELKMKLFLSERYAMNEVHSYLWYESKLNKEIGIVTEPNIRVINSLTAENDTIRSTIIPSLLGFVYKNVDTTPEMGMFEIGRVSDGLKEDGLCNERKRLGIVVASKKLSEKEVYFKVKEIVEQLLLAIKNVRPVFAIKEELSKYNYVHPVNSAKISLKGEEIGYFSVLNPKVKNKIDKKLNVAYAEIDVELLETVTAETLRYVEPSKYPGVTIDLSLLTEKELRFEKIAEYIGEYKCEYLKSFHLVDIFEDEKLLPGKKSVTIRFEFVSMERTLEGQEISAMTDELLAILKAKGIELR